MIDWRALLVRLREIWGLSLSLLLRLQDGCEASEMRKGGKIGASCLWI